jgi:hypothetical protein
LMGGIEVLVGVVDVRDPLEADLLFRSRGRHLDCVVSFSLVLRRGVWRMI